MEEKIEIIVRSICKIKGVEEKEIINILNDANCKYLLFLLMRKYKCKYNDNIRRELNINNDSKIKRNFKKAKEKFLVNRDFREEYLEVSSLVEKKLNEGI